MEENEFFDIGFEDAVKLDIFNVPDVSNTETEEPEKPKETEEKPKEQPKENKQPEESNQGNENPNEPSESKGSPNDNISSSIALTLADNGVLQTLDEERLKKVDTMESFIEAFEEELNNRLDEKQKRIDNALNANIPVDRIKQYESIIDELNKINESDIGKEGEDYENYRKNLIYRSYLIKGISEDEAAEMTEYSVEKGKDIDDAKKALNSIKKYYNDAYNKEIEDNRKAQEKRIAEQKKMLKELETSIIDDDEFYNSLEINKTVRKKILDTAIKPIRQEDGSQITAVQKFMKENPNKALKMFATMMVLTEDFTKFDNLFKGTVKKQVKESTRNLQRLLNQTSPIDGSLQFKSGVSEKIDTSKIIDFDID